MAQGIAASEVGLREADGIVARHEAVKAALAKAPGPTLGELLELLGSTDAACRGLALPVVIAKKIADERVVLAVLRRYHAGDPYLIRADTFVYLSFVLSEKQRTDNVRLVRPILCAETDSSLLAIALFHIDEFATSEAVELYACYLKHESRTLRTLTFGLLRGAGATMLGLVRERLQQEGAQSALEFLSQPVETGGRP